MHASKTERPPPLAVETAISTRDLQGTALGIVQLTKPAVTRLVMVTAVGGALVAPSPIEPLRLVVTLLGTAMVVGAANSLNMFLERDVDALMERTRQRPLPSGRVAPETALGLGVLSAVAGLAVLSFSVSPLTGFLAATALLSYVLVYTPLKRVTPYALHVGAVPGAIPPLIGYASVTGRVDAQALSLFAVLFVWQLPHFIAISLFRRDEYARAGLRVHGAVRSVDATRRAIWVYSTLMILIGFVPLWVGLGSATYALLAAVAGVAFVAFALATRRRTAALWARGVFFATLPYLVLIYGGLVAAAW